MADDLRETRQGYLPGIIEHDVVDRASGLLHITKVQDCDAVLRGARAVREAVGVRPKGDTHYVGSVPVVLAQTWARECGAGIGTREFAEYAKKKILSNEFTLLRGD
jgi:hypothetical protein